MNAAVYLSVKKAIIGLVLFGIPVLLNVLPQETLNLTIGGVLVLIYSYLKTGTSLGSKLP